MIGVLLAATLAAATPQKIEILVPDRENLQYLAFWTALAAKHFEAKGLEVSLLVPGTPGEAEDFMRQGKAQIAVLSPPMYLRLIAEQAPIVLAANLLANDPIDLIVQGDIAKERKLDRKGVGGLYAHTPFLERALVDQGAYLLVDQASGEVPALANRQLHALVVTRKIASEQPKLAGALVSAIAAAEAQIHHDPRAVIAALAKAMPETKKPHLEKIVELYGPAIPEKPSVTADGIESALDFFPSHATKPSFDGVALDNYVLGRRK